MAFSIPPLPYATNALEPYVDARTMEIHHGKHHAAYATNLNNAIAGTEWENKSIEEICANVANLPENIRMAVRNNGGGFYNHNLFWEIMAPNAGGEPTGELAELIDAAFGNFSVFKETFTKAGITRFGSGWAWLLVNHNDELQIASTANQDNPLMGTAIAGCSGTPILGLDVWEHAYYLNYQNRRPDYINAWWNVVNWSEVARRLAAIR
ncbi:MAG TPA: superoxide dismutase [Anaerolineales bacterium]|nr:superoxide dismutase [Anaerolineales bacterium]